MDGISGNCMDDAHIMQTFSLWCSKENTKWWTVFDCLSPLSNVELKPFSVHPIPLRAHTEKAILVCLRDFGQMTLPLCSNFITYKMEIITVPLLRGALVRTK